MTVTELLRLAWGGMAAYRLRSVLTILSVTVGVAALVAVLAIGRGTHQQALAELRQLGGDMAYLRPDEGNQLPVTLRPDDASSVRAMVPGVLGAWPVMTVTGVQVRYGDEEQVLDIIGVPPPLGQVLWRKLQTGRFLRDEDQTSARKQVVLGAKLAERLFAGRLAPGEIVFLNNHPFVVSGVLAPSSELAASAFGVSNDEVVIVPLLTLQRLTGSYDMATTLMVQAATGQDPDAVGAQAAAVLARIHGGGQFRVDTWRPVLDSFTRISDLIVNIMAVIAGIAMSAGGTGITNIMLASVVERTREIGIRRAVGAKRRDIFLQFITEALVLSLSGGLIGAVAAWIPVSIARRWIKLSLSVTWDVALAGIVLALLLGLVFGVWPAWRAARLEPVAALRQET